MGKKLTHLVGGVTLTGLLISGYGMHQQAAQAAKPAAQNTVTFVTDVGGLNDNGFNHLGYIGSKAGAQQVNWKLNDIETTSASDYVKNLTSAAQRSQMVVAVGFSFGDPLKQVAAKFPNVKFSIIDWDYTPPISNVSANIFNPNEPSYLAGILAAGMSKTHTIGFVGGVNVPLIQAFLAGYQAGARSVDPAIKVKVSYTGSFTDQGKGKVAGLQEINAGADVIYAAAGGSGLGALAAANQKHVWSIGVDTDQHYLYPNSVLTSVLKHVERATTASIVSVAHNTFKSGTITWNLKNGGVGLAPYYNLDSKVPASVKDQIAKAQNGIISGSIKVPDHL